MTVRTPDYVFAHLMAEENLNRHVGIQGLLRPTGTYDVVSVTFLEDIRRPISKAPVASPSVRAQAAEAAATRAAERVEAAGEAAAAQFESRLRK
jgi:hypothetical protein